MPPKPPNSSAPPPIRYEATLRHLSKCLTEYKDEAAKFRAAHSSESAKQRYQAALRRMLEALIQNTEEVLKLAPQLKRPN